MHLVIVESPAKGKTIEKYLGHDYKVMASFGHVRDLPERNLGVDPEHDFTPEYRILPKAKKTISGLEAALKHADHVYLATDYDREGEAIAWHLVHALKLDKKPNIPVDRITFHEITKDAIQDAVQHPRQIDEHLVDAQQARRILDRLVGYKLSPFLWKKVMKGLSAGRVQSVAVRLIVDREREITAFVPQEYWSIEADLTTDSKEKQFSAQLISQNGQKVERLTISSQADAESIMQRLEEAIYKVKNIETRDQQKRPPSPFTTSTLQQEASHRLGYSAKRTMKLAQDLYEDGKITYMRTDSMNLASVAVDAARNLIEKDFGKQYLPSEVRVYKTKAKGAQEAHEAIRPTDLNEKPESISVADNDHRRLYELIWQRTIACQMESAVMAMTRIEVEATAKDGVFGFSASGSMIKFDGFLKVWPSKVEERELPTLEPGKELELVDLKKDQHFTEPPARFNEASLIKALEEYGIGRPSTYAPTIATIVDRGYVRVENRVFFPQQIGEVVTDLLKEHFPDIVDIGFTAQMEENLDGVAEGKENWVEVLKTFYVPFEKQLEDKLGSVKKLELVTETTDEVCDKCGKPMQVKLGRFGKFLACTGFPDCRNTKPLVTSTGVKCPVCGQGELVERKTRRGKTFWSCDRYPDCKAATWDLQVPATLPDPNKIPKWKQKKQEESSTAKKTAPKKKKTTKSSK